MKQRNGFVSNSSSSSFVIGVGKVRNRERLLERLGGLSYKDPEDAENWDGVYVTTWNASRVEVPGAQIVRGLKGDPRHISVKSFDDTEVALKCDKLSDGDQVLIVRVNDCNEDMFYDDDGKCKGYDIDFGDLAPAHQRTRHCTTYSRTVQ